MLDSLTARVDAELSDVLAERDIPLYEMMSYHLGWEARRGHDAGSARRRVHGVACLLACSAAGGDTEVALPAAAAVEMVHGFGEIHDDIQDGNPKRGHRDSVWSVWGPAQAINAGDGMHALARLALLKLLDRGLSAAATFRATQLLDQACLTMCEGRFRYLEAQELIDTGVDGYLKTASEKSGALMAGAMKLGALVASSDETILQALGECGARIGLGMQVRRDLRALWGDDSREDHAGPEVLGQEKSLPVVYALEKASVRDKRQMGSMFLKRALDPGDVAMVREVMDRLGAKEYCEDLISRYHCEAIEALAFPGALTEGMEAIEEFADWLLGSRQTGNRPA